MNRSTDSEQVTKRQKTALAYEVWPPMPSGRLDCYTLLWQLELWLREIVYLELKTRYGSAWASHIVVQSGKRSRQIKKGLSEAGARSQLADSRLTHMPTRERNPLSYITFDTLLKTVSRHWRLFAPYLPVLSIWKARMEEVSQIRNRVAHFRNGHPGDLQRVGQVLNDIDKGVWVFVTSYNNPHPIYPPRRDKVAKQFIELDPFPWSATGDNGIIRLGIAPRDMRIGVTVEVLRRPWLRAKFVGQVASKYGYLYDVQITARQGRVFNYRRFLEGTKRDHDICCHIVLDAMSNGIRLTIPSVTGATAIVEGLSRFIAAAERTLLPSVSSIAGNVAAIVSEWPEYVLAPDNPLAFLSPDMPCRMTGGLP
ncbi:hypothetical protein FJ936_23905 [Mesorhizobium sp. B2-4-13]|uniref:hypothetical protein n=1 Tax=Mesorhizobium sp. B2-4-13 TaxID=2589936 RepID=UPI00114F675A|nr:hypothetical protein [Mesorhizobium sp. B2-4-13]TPK82543.1 hypothetical protein FJ936_23905 [Mesorhizobium sp. B2-4-13]